jgi:hypothetical protein
VQPLFEGVVADVDFGDFEGVGREVDGIDLGLRVVVRQQDREAGRAGADIDDARDLLGVGQPLVDLLGDELEEIGARDEHALIDVETVVAEQRLLREVGGGSVVDGAAEEDLAHGLGLHGRHAAAQHGLVAIHRDAEGVQEEIERLVVRGGGDLSEREALALVERLGPAEPVAHGAAGFGTGEHSGGGGSTAFGGGLLHRPIACIRSMKGSATRLIATMMSFWTKGI